MMKTNVCHIISGDLWAGAEVMANNLIQAQATEYNLCVIILNRGKLHEKLSELNVQVVLVDESEIGFISIAVRVLRVLKAFRPDIVHSHRYKENILAFLARQLVCRKAKLVTTQHGLPEAAVGKHTLVNRIANLINYRLVLRRFNKIVAVSSEIKTRLHQQFKLPESKLAKVHNGVLVPDATQSVGRNDKLTIGSAGRFVPVKNYSLMIEIARAICDRFPNVRFLLAGDGPLLGELQAKIKAHRLEDNFNIVGFFENIADYYSQIDIFINTSDHEGVPMSILEAMARGIPVVASNVGGIAEIITDRVDGFLLDPTDSSGFVKTCLSIKDDPSLVSRVSKAARDKISNNFSSQKMSHDYSTVYKSLLPDRLKADFKKVATN